jgi:hypothetical protein
MLEPVILQPLTEANRCGADSSMGTDAGRIRVFRPHRTLGYYGNARLPYDLGYVTIPHGTLNPWIVWIGL